MPKLWKGQVRRLEIIRQINPFSNSARARAHAVRNAVIQIVVVTAAFILMVRIFPMGTVQNHVVSGQKAVDIPAKAELTGDIFTDRDKKLQTVYFTQSHIYRITLYMRSSVPKDAPDTEHVLFRLYDDTFSCIYETEADSKKIEKDGCLTAVPDMDVDVGKAYYYEILVDAGSRAAYVLPVAARAALAQEENSTLFIDGILNDEVCLIADFEYTSPLSVLGILAYDILVVIAAAAVYLLLILSAHVYDVYWSQDSERIGKFVRTAVAVVSVLAALALFFYAVVCNKFGGELWDRLFFSIGIVVAEAWLLGALWRMTRVIRPKKRTKASAGSKICLVWRNYIQTVSFGLLFYALCQYVNADRNYYHYTNTRWMLIFLAAALLMNYNQRLFLNRISAAWFGLGVVGSVLYCNGFRADEKELILARLTCGVVIAWGLLILCIIQSIVRAEKIKFWDYVKGFHDDVLYTAHLALWILFGLLMYAYRFEKVWVITATLPFAAYFFAKGTPAAKSRFLRNFSNGILLSFALVTAFCLHHRPHHYWMLYRYGGMFHTVACTGMYLAVVFGAALAKLYGKLKTRTSMVKICYREYFVTACVTGFILLTMSRTAFLTTIVTVLSIVALTAAAYRKKAKRIALELGVLAGVCLVSFPMVFTAVRMVPAVINDPVRYEIEFQDKSFMIYEGDPIDSDKYMTVRRFFSTLFGRFQTDNAQAHAGLTLQDAGLFAYTGDDFAGLDMRAADGGDGGAGGYAEEKNDVSNGRFDIFKAYLEALEIHGHPKMGPSNEKGEEYAHAHNSYLQVAYNFGMIAGVMFLALCALTLWRSIRLFIKYGKKYNIFLVPFALVIVFGFVSLTEWAFHPCIPAGFSFLMMLVVLIHKDASENKSPGGEDSYYEFF